MPHVNGISVINFREMSKFCKIRRIIVTGPLCFAFECYVNEFTSRVSWIANSLRCASRYLIAIAAFSYVYANLFLQAVPACTATKAIYGRSHNAGVKWVERYNVQNAVPGWTIWFIDAFAVNQNNHSLSPANGSFLLKFKYYLHIYKHVKRQIYYCDDTEE